MLDGCQGKPRTPTIIEKICPQCGAEIEVQCIGEDEAEALDAICTLIETGLENY